MASAGRARVEKRISKASDPISAEPLAGRRARAVQTPDFSHTTLAALKKDALTSKGAEFKQIISELERRALDKPKGTAGKILRELAGKVKPAQRKLVLAAIERIDATCFVISKLIRLEAEPAQASGVPAQDERAPILSASLGVQEQPAEARGQAPLIVQGEFTLPVHTSLRETPAAPSGVLDLSQLAASSARAVPLPLSKVEAPRVSRQKFLFPLLFASALALVAVAAVINTIPSIIYFTSKPPAVSHVEKKPALPKLRRLEPFVSLPATLGTVEPVQAPPVEVQSGEPPVEGERLQALPAGRPAGETEQPAVGRASTTIASRPSQPEGGAAPPKPKDSLPLTPKGLLDAELVRLMGSVSPANYTLQTLLDAASAFALKAITRGVSFDDARLAIETLTLQFGDEQVFETLSQADRVYVVSSLRATAERVAKKHPENAGLRDFVDGLKELDVTALKQSDVYDYSTAFAIAARSAGVDWRLIETILPSSRFIQGLAAYAVNEAQRLEAQVSASALQPQGVAASGRETKDEKPSSARDALAEKTALFYVYGFVLDAAKTIGGIEDYEHRELFSAFAGRLSAVDPNRLSLKDASEILVEYCLLMREAGKDWSEMAQFMPPSTRFPMLNYQALAEAKKRVK
ncbi:hypothetical protein HY992_04875 [Candidatus Micrarchaeota archaeon]|nr:hypothetical protein [Candidatus Micrarchaeota archaeon]